MRALINCDACPDPHREDNLEGVILIRKPLDARKGEYECPYYFPGDILVAIKKGDDIEICKPGKFTSRQLEAIATGIMHLAAKHAAT